MKHIKTFEQFINEKANSVNEGLLTSKDANKLSIGDTLKTDKHTYKITGYSNRSNAFKQFEVEDENGERYNIQVSLRGSTGIKVAKGHSLNFPEQEEILEEFKVDKSINEGIGNYSLLDFFREMQSFVAAGVDNDDITAASSPNNKKKTVRNTPKLKRLMNDWKDGYYDEDPGTLVDNLRRLLESTEPIIEKKLDSTISDKEETMKHIKTFEQFINESEFQKLSPNQFKLKNAIKDQEKENRLAKDDKEFPALALNKIMLAKVLNRGKLDKEYEETYKELLNKFNLTESINEGVSNELFKYVKSKYRDERVNFVTFEELLEPLAEHIDSYTGSNMGDLEYTKETINLFKKLVDSMSKAHIDGSLMESKVNEAFDSKQIRLVISSEDDTVTKNQDRIMKVLDAADNEHGLKFFEATGKIVGNIAKAKLKTIQNNIRGISRDINVEVKKQTLK
jgi:hypothetical protein